MNRPWHEIAASFRNRMEITIPREEFVVWLLAALFLLIASFWLVNYLRQWKQFREASEFLEKYELSGNQRRLINLFIRDSCHGKPQHIQQSLSAFNLWVDRKLRQRQELGEVVTAGTSIVLDIKRIRDSVFFNQRAQRPFASSRDLEPNQTLSLEVAGLLTVYNAAIVELDDLGLTLLMTGGIGTPPASVGTTVVGALAQPEGMYNFEAEYLGPVPGQAGSIRISHSRDWRAIQLRAHYRHPVHLPVEFRYFKRLPNGEAIVKESEGTLIELSGGGFTLISHLQNVEGGMFTFDLNLAGKFLARLTGNITRQFFDKSSSDYTSFHCEFVDLDPESREDIIHYIFQKQREL